MYSITPVGDAGGAGDNASLMLGSCCVSSVKGFIYIIPFNLPPSAVR